MLKNRKHLSVSHNTTYMFQRKAEDEVKGGGGHRAAERGGARDHADWEGGEEASGDNLVELGADDASEEEAELRW